VQRQQRFKTSVLMGSILGDMSKKAKGPGAVSLESLKAQLEASSGSGTRGPSAQSSVWIDRVEGLK